MNHNFHAAVRFSLVLLPVTMNFSSASRLKETTNGLVDHDNAGINTLCTKNELKIMNRKKIMDLVYPV